MTSSAKNGILEKTKKEEIPMKILYKDPEDHTLCVMEVTGTTYYQEEGILEFTGDSDIGIQVSEAEAEEVVRLLFDTDQADLTNYNTCVVEMEFEDDEDDEEDLDDFFDDLLDNEDEDGYRLPHRIAFPKK